MYWIELNTLARDGAQSRKILCNLQLVTSLEDQRLYDRGTKVQYDKENYFYVQETPEQILKMYTIGKR